MNGGLLTLPQKVNKLRSLLTRERDRKGFQGKGEDNTTNGFLSQTKTG